MAPSMATGMQICKNAGKLLVVARQISGERVCLPDGCAPRYGHGGCAPAA